MKTETKHTPTPWTFQGCFNGPTICICPNDGKTYQDGQAIAVVAMRGDESAFNQGEQTANAAFIVRACNEYDALRETVSALISVLPYGNEALQIKAEKLLRGELS